MSIQQTQDYVGILPFRHKTGWEDGILLERVGRFAMWRLQTLFSKRPFLCLKTCFLMQNDAFFRKKIEKMRVLTFFLGKNYCMSENCINFASDFENALRDMSLEFARVESRFN